MHVMRPKSAKGRTRPRVTQVQRVEEDRVHPMPSFCPHPPSSPRPNSTLSHRFDASICPHTVLRRDCKPSPEILTELQKASHFPEPSLNRYSVLPSIGKRPESSRTIAEKPSRLNTHHVSGRCTKPGSMNRPFKACGSSDPSGSDTVLLLAVRTPSGQRFEHHFRSTETLRSVVAAAENKSGMRYENALIETMEVPRRSFSNLTMTLSQCAIFNKSVLCISLEDGATDSYLEQA